MTKRIPRVDATSNQLIARGIRSTQTPSQKGKASIAMTQMCSIDGCEKPLAWRGWCYGHYKRWQKYGEPTGVPTGSPTRTLEERFWEKVDKTGDCWLWMAAISRDGYGHISVDDRMVRAHRVSYELHQGPIPDGMQIDHVCHQTRCVNPAHLRLATNKQNCENRSRSSNGSGIRGVSQHPVTGRWRADVCHHGRRYYLGIFATIEEAAEAAKAKRLELFTHNDADREAS